jgi:polysaccharide biosynthesis protein PslE
MSRSHTGTGSRPPSDPPHPRDERRELDLYDLIEMIWSQRGMIIAVFLVLFVAGAAASFLLLDKTYEARARLLVLLDDEDLTPGAAGSGDGFVIEQIMQSESEIMNSETVRRIALENIGPAAVLPEGGSEALALRAMRQSFSVVRAPNASVLIPVLEADSPDRAETVLNAIVDAYLEYRQVVLTGDGATGVADRRLQSDQAYTAALDALDRFLTENDITEYESDIAALLTQIAALQTSLATAQSERQAASAAASAIAQRVAEMPENIDLYVESSAENLLIENRLERESLLARYLETAPPVVALDREIAELEDFIAGGGVEGLGQRRTGVNTVRQGLVQEQMRLESVAAAEATRARTISAQLSAAESEIARLRSLAPDYRRLAQDVAATSAAATSLATQQAEAEARQSLAPGSADAVRIVERAFAPAEGSSLKKLGVAAAFVFAAGTAILMGLLRGYWSRHVGPGAQARPIQQRTQTADLTDAIGPMPSRVAGVPVLARMPDRGSALGRR